jgi:hypothetical protein
MSESPRRAADWKVLVIHHARFPAIDAQAAVKHTVVILAFAIKDGQKAEVKQVDQEVRTKLAWRLVT